MNLKLLKNESGISLMVLVITVVVMMILTFAIVVNYQNYSEEVKMTEFTNDFVKLKEEIDQYYSKNKTLPIRNKYLYSDASKFLTVQNKNDAPEEYYVIDLDKINVDLHYGEDFELVKQMDASEPVSIVMDIFIINAQSHTIYYPKGERINGTVYYKIVEKFAEVNGHTDVVLDPTINIFSMDNSDDYLFSAKAVVKIEDGDLTRINLSQSKYVFTENSQDINDINEYTDGNLTGLTTTIEKALPAGTWFLHVILTDTDGDTFVETSADSVTIAETAEFPYEADASKRENRKASLMPGTYKLECWGAQGGGNTTGGYGAYTSGNITINNNTDLYVYVGNKPERTEDSFNGGGKANNNHYPSDDGGGATDFRTVNGSWDNFASLKSRIMVAAAGGGYEAYQAGAQGGAAGGLTGYNGQYSGPNDNTTTTGGTQTAGGSGDQTEYSGENGSFGKGGNGDLEYGGGRSWCWILWRRPEVATSNTYIQELEVHLLYQDMLDVMQFHKIQQKIV